jgi:hypothetical protein
MRRRLAAWRLSPLTEFSKLMGRTPVILTAALALFLLLLLPLASQASVRKDPPTSYPTFFMAPVNPSAYEDGIAMDINIAIEESLGLNEILFESRRTFDVSITVVVSLPRNASIDDLQWELTVIPDITQVGTDQNGNGDGDHWQNPGPDGKALVSPRIFEGDIDGVSVWNPDRQVVVVETYLRTYMPTPQRNFVDGQWAETWSFFWTPPSIGAEPGFQSLGDVRIEDVAWAQLSQQDLASVGPPGVVINVCPSCSPILGYNGAIPYGPNHLRINTPYDMPYRFVWGTPWYPWAWIMPAHGILVGAFSGALLASALSWGWLRLRANTETGRHPEG